MIDRWVDRSIEIYDKELAHIIMEAEKSQGLRAATWKPKRANGVDFHPYLSLKVEE